MVDGKQLKTCGMAVMLSVLAGTPVHAAQSPMAADYDPWAPFNQRMFAFNQFFDDNFLRPVARGYVDVVPQPVKMGVSNFFSNLGDIRILINDTLQLKLREAASDSGRLLLNTTVGIGGLLDVASAVGLQKNDEDFGQTLGAWGIDSGPYLVLPFIGSSTVRDTFGLVGDVAANPISASDDSALRFSLWALSAVESRADALQFDRLMYGDEYLFVREAYLQRRHFEVTDGEVDTGWRGEDADWDDWD